MSPAQALSVHTLAVRAAASDIENGYRATELRGEQWMWKLSDSLPLIDSDGNIERGVERLFVSEYLLASKGATP